MLTEVRPFKYTNKRLILSTKFYKFTEGRGDGGVPTRRA